MTNPDSLAKMGSFSKTPPGALEIPDDEQAEVLTRPSPSNPKLPIKERLMLAAHRREEFRAWVLNKARSKKQPASAGPSRQDDRKQRLLRLKERQDAAEQTRAQLLDEVRQKAASVGFRRETALARINKRQGELAHKVAHSLSAAEERRNALQEAERERLRADHSLVLTRLALSKDDASPSAEAARKRLEERLASAEEQRQQRLAQAAQKAGSQVQHAKAVSALTKQLAKQQAVDRLESLQARLDNAEARRLASRPLLSPTSPRKPRVSVGGSICITSPPLTRETSTVGEDSSEAVTPPARAAPTPHGTPITPINLSQQVSTQLLEEVGTLVDRAQLEPTAIAKSPAPVTAAAAGVAAAGAPQDSPVGDSVRAARLEELRRSVSSRRLQAAWRAFRGKHKTTAALCQTFADTGVIQLGPVSRRTSQAGSPSAPTTSPAPAASLPAPTAVVIGGVPSSPTHALHGADKFDAFAQLVQSPGTLRAASALLRRLEARLMLKSGKHTTTASGAAQAPGPAGETHHHHHHHHHHKAGARGAAANVAGVPAGGSSERNVTRVLRRLYPDLPKDRVPDRYPPRILLCSLMIIHYPEVVFNGTGEREPKLAAAAKEMLHKFERLLARILDPPAPPSSPPGATHGALPAAALLSASPVAVGMQSYIEAMKAAGGNVSGSDGAYVTIGQRLVEFDEAWLQYLDQFAAWKLEDAASLESELIRVAAEMERSLQRKLIRSATASPTGTPHRSARNLDNVAAQVRHDYELLRERVERLSGAPGLARLDAALQSVRDEVALESASELDTEASEMESTSDAEGNTRARGAAAASPQGAARPARPAGGIKRGFFSPIAPNSIPGTPPRATSATGTPGTASPHRAALPPGSPRTPWATAGRFQPTSPIAPQGSMQPYPGGANAQQQPPPEVIISDVRAPSVPRSPIASSSGIASPAPELHSGPLSPTQDSAVGESIANLQMVWELVRNPGHRVSAAEAEAAWARACAPAGTPLAPLDPEELESLAGEALAGAIREHARAVAEAVFWDSVAARIKTAVESPSGGLLDIMAPLLSELGCDLADVISQPAVRAALQAEFAEPSVREALGGPGAPPSTALPLLAGRLQRLANLLLENGAPAREEEVKAVHASMAAQLTATIPAALGALAQGAGEGAEVAQLSGCIGRALRVLLAQLKLLKLDAANGRLALLYQQVKGDAGITYLRTKFGALHSLPADWDTSSTGSSEGGTLRSIITERLPRTAAWVHRAAAAASGIHGYLASVGLDVDSDQLQAAARDAVAVAAAAAAVPAALRSGIRSPGLSTSGTSAAAAAVAAPLPPCPLHSWNGLVRTGLVALVSSDKPAVGMALAETLAWDAERLHAAQNTFQQLVVVTAGLLLVQQTRARSNRPPLPPAQLNSARRRVLVVLADPSMSLQGLVTELYSLVTAAPSAPSAAPVGGVTSESAAATTAADQVAEEAALGAAFRALMNPSSAAFTSISNALAGALALHLLLGPDAVTSDAAGVARGLGALLGRVGAGALAGDVASLGASLRSMCSISETVFGPVYQSLV